MQKIEAPIEIHAYTGYGNKNSIYCYGRILKKTKLYNNNSNNKLLQLINTIKRLRSGELPHFNFTFDINGFTKKHKTNTEGFYLIHEKVNNEKKSNLEEITIKVLQEDVSKKFKKSISIEVTGEIIFPKENATLGFISDLDDTIIKTDVLSKYRWKMFYNAFLLNVTSRKAIHGTSAWYNKMHKNLHPFFYVSNSPWNFYDYITQFLHLNEYPKGPVLLRDYGRKATDALQDYEQHKKHEIEKIIEMYPQLQFVLIGDGGERDADIYLEMYQKYPGKIKAIFIRRLGDLFHQSRLEKLAEGHEDYFFLFKKAEEAEVIAERLGLS